MDNYIRYLLPNQVYSIIGLFNPVYIILTFIIIFLINIYLKILFLYDNIFEIEKIFHKKSFDPIYIILTFIIIFLINSYLKILFLYDNLSEIQKIFHKKCKNIKLINDSNHTLLYRLNDDIKSIKKNLEKKFENFNSIIEEARKKLLDHIESVKDEIYSDIKEDTKKELFNLQLVIEDSRKELLNEVDIDNTKVKEVYSELDSLK